MMDKIERKHPWLYEANLVATIGDAPSPAIDLVYKNMDILFVDNKFSDAIDIIDTMDLTKYHDDILYAMVVATSWEWRKLPSRGAFCRKVKNELIRRKIPKDDIDNMFMGLDFD